MTTSSRRFEQLKKVLCCSECRGNLIFTASEAACEKCAAVYPIRQGKIYFVEVPKTTDELDTIKGRLKRWLGKYYYKIGLNVLAPTFPFNYLRKIKQFFDPAQQIVVDVGCGNNRIDENIIGIDLFDYEAVDVVCDLIKLPFKPDSVDGFASRSVLEHVPNPALIVKQLYECTKPGGYGVHLIPFLYPFHASPHDYQRFTLEGQKVLFTGWEIIEQTNPTGPVTLVLLCLIEFLSIVLSFGNLKVKGYLYLFFCGILFPFKYLDFIFANRKSFVTLAPSILALVRKYGK